jgi:probable rRNA maturation factor
VEISILIEGKFAGCPDKKWFQKIAEKVLIAQGAGDDVELGLVITTQEKVRELNRTYRGKDKPTDVLAFYMMPAEEEDFPTPPDGARHLGEVVISFPQAVIQANEQGHPVKRELAILTIHGILHLLGYDHEKPEARRRMRSREVALLKSVDGELDER